MASRRRDAAAAAAGPSQSSDRASALEQIRNLRQKNGKRVDAFNLKLEEKVYDEVSEPDYALLVAQRREEAKGFVVDDGDLGYADIGEEEEWDVNVYSDSEGDEDESRRKKPRQSKEGDPKKKEAVSKAAAAAAAAAALNKQRVSTMFAAASGLSTKAKDDWRAADSENVLEDVLAGIGVDTVDREKEKRRRLGVRGQAAARIGIQGAGPQRSASHTVSYTVPSIARKPIREARDDDDEARRAVGDSPQETCPHVEDGLDPCWHIEDALSALPDSPPAVLKLEQVPDVDELSSTPNPAPVVPPPPVDSGKVGLNAKVASTAPSAPAASAAWQAIREGGAGEKLEVVEEEQQVEIAPADIADFPLDDDGRLPFYLIDAHEEGFGANPGTVYLFGKVLYDGKHVSCCVVVRNIQRCIYAIPAPSVFPATELALLQGAAQSDGKAGAVALIAKLQELAGDMKDEIAQKLLDLNVAKFSMVPVKRSYAFERQDVTSGEHYFIKLSYPFKDTALPADMKGTTFSGLFGTQTSALELLLIKKKIKGPCWLSIANPVFRPSPSQVSWCKLEVVVDSPKNLTTAVSDTINQQIPTLVVAAINLKTVVNHKQNVNEVAAASVVYCRHVQVDAPMLSTHWNTHKMLNHFSVVRKLDGGIFPLGFTSEATSTNAKAGSNVLSCEGSERALLNNLMIKLHQLDADIFVGHNISGFDLDVLLHRLQACKVPSSMWSKIGRLKRSMMPKLNGGGYTFGAGAGPGAMACIAGRLLCDTYLAARDLVQEVSYSLTQLSKSQLGRERKELIPSEIPSMYKTSASLFELVESGETDAWLSLSLMFHLNVLPLTRQLTNISGNLWGKTLQGARAQRVEYLLLHEFHSRKFIVPDKLTLREKERITVKRKKLSSPEVDGGEELAFGDENIQEETLVGPSGKRRKGPAYSGGLVLEPKKGLYDKYILLLDFNSLYPSIIQEYNVCFTTVERSDEDTIPALPTCDTPGVLPQVLKSLVERRKQVKQWLKRTSDNLKYQQLNIQQQALKLTANSMYGCLGFPNSRFYAKPIAELITSQGREILQSTVDLVQNTLNFEVIYGDTDSIMIHTGLDDPVAARDIGVKVIKEVNKKYRLLEIDMDGLYKRMLLLKKKKYAAVKVVPTGDGTFGEVIEQKGLDIVRRDWSMLSKEIGNFCLGQILSGGLREEVVENIHNQLRMLQEEMRSGQVELDKYVITKTLTKNPEEYPDARNQPHVQVALRRRLSGHRIGCFVGDTVPYVICLEKDSEGGPSSGIADRARHPDELKQDSGNWVVDIDYYIQQQIHPVVMRLCAPIEGTDSGRLAECLGLDPLKFQQRHSSSTNDRDDALVSSSAILDDADRYRTCEPLQLICPCSQRFDFAGVDSIIASASHQTGSPESLSHRESPFRCPRCRHHGGADTEAPARLANQVKQRAEEFVTRYYEGWMMCDDEICGHMTRNITLRVSGDADRGTVCPNYPRCNGRLARQYTQADLYNQLSHFCRLLDVPRAMEKIEDEEGQMAVKTQLSTVLDPLVEAADVMVQGLVTSWNLPPYTHPGYLGTRGT